MVTTRPPKTIVKPTALGPVANTDTKLLIYGLFQKGRVLAQDGVHTQALQQFVLPKLRHHQVQQTLSLTVRIRAVGRESESVEHRQRSLHQVVLAGQTHLGGSKIATEPFGPFAPRAVLSRDESANKRRNHAGMVPADRRLIKFGARG